MHFPPSATRVGAFLRWGGLFAVVLAIVGGILGMHVVNGVPAVAAAPAGMSGAMMTQGMSQSSSTAVHRSAESGHSPHTSVSETLSTVPACACLPDGCAASMAMHGDCTPTLSAPALNVPLPGTLSTHGAGTAFAVVTVHPAADRLPDAPSLEKLSISRT